MSINLDNLGKIDKIELEDYNGNTTQIIDLSEYSIADVEEYTKGIATLRLQKEIK